MRLSRFRVTNFRSVDDSGWIEGDRVIALIGVNESGKTNLLLPLWKFNPAREGELQPTADYPKKRFGEIRQDPSKFSFISIEFEMNSAEADGLAQKGEIPVDACRRVVVSRFFDGSYELRFPDFNARAKIPKSEFAGQLDGLASVLNAAPTLAKEEGLKERILTVVSDGLVGAEDIDALNLKDFIQRLQGALPEQVAKSSAIVPLTRQSIDVLSGWLAELQAKPPQDRAGVLEHVTDAMPSFVYYSNYGNLDSEIYLPHVVQNLDRSDLGAKEAAKARTLRVLFSFVKLKPTEILELGRDFKESNYSREPTPAEIEQISEKKKERSILLQSASGLLTSRFRDWWKQGNYRFRFEADGNHFRIWVSDEQRPDEVELENRSTGLQWFLSFYLVFLVETLGEHRDAILLLDEPGLSLHPLAQRDLSAFFDGLADTNQLVYTTHSPFLVDADRLERARKVYVANDGTTKATSDLRFSESTKNPQQSGAAYAVHSALNLNVAESLMLGCDPILVEGASDQHYLTAIKTLLIGASRITPKRELVFPPCGGTKTVRIVASILTGRDEKAPMVILDGDEHGKRMGRELRAELYADAHERLLLTDEYVGFEKSEVEDLFPPRFIADVLDRWQRTSEVLFADVLEIGSPIVPQVEKWAKEQSIDFPEHWKVELAKRVKQRALDQGHSTFSVEVLERWERLFSAFK